jgi:hypothetical protein
MMKTLFRSFAGGEVTPELYGRLDLVKWQTGLALVRNFTILPHGPATRRPGLRFCTEARDSTTSSRRIPFHFNSGSCQSNHTSSESLSIDESSVRRSKRVLEISNASPNPSMVIDMQVTDHSSPSQSSNHSAQEGRLYRSISNGSGGSGRQGSPQTKKLKIQRFK